MTKEEIIAMKPGRELNIAVAEVVMKHKVIVDEIFGEMERYIANDGSSVYSNLQPYSKDRSIAQQVVDKLKNNYSARVEFNYYTEKWEAEFSELETGLSSGTVSALDAPEAICKATLLVILEKGG